MFTAIIVNPISGRAGPDAGRTRVQQALAVVNTHRSPAEVFVTERAGHARELAKAAVHRGARLIIAWGGDGTINEVASALAFGDVPLGIVPAGSGNGLATELGVSRRPEQAIAAALAAEPRPMDLGELDGRLFTNIAGIGFDAHVAAEFNGPGNTRRGLAGYAAIAGRALFAYKPESYTITCDGQTSAATAVLVSIANSAQYGNNARIAPAARVDDGELDLVVFEESSRLATIFALRRLFDGTVEKQPGCTIRRMTRATIECSRPMVYHVDGEPFAGGTRLDARVHPGALRIAVS